VENGQKGNDYERNGNVGNGEMGNGHVGNGHVGGHGLCVYYDEAK